MATQASMAPLSNRRLGEFGKKVMMTAGLVGLAGLAISVVVALLGGGEQGWERFLRSYLMAFNVVLTICLGALFFTILQHCVKAGWSVVIRRISEGVASNLLWIWVLFIPVVIAMFSGHLYEWVNPPADDHVLQHKTPYLNPAFWTIRAVVFFGIWAFLAWFFYSNSVKQDASGDPAITRRMEKFAPVAVGLYFVSAAFAGMDWVMSLEPHWFSTMFPVYFFSASCCGYFAVQILMAYFAQKNGLLTREITPEHYQDFGKLLFAFGIVFWSYIAFSQMMLIWYANLPEETPWYIARMLGGWQNVSWLLLFGHFAIPFVGLISRHPKRSPRILILGAGWMLFMHVIDVYWLVMPKVPEAIKSATSYQQLARDVAANEALSPTDPNFNHALDVGFGFHLLDLTCLVGLLGLVVAATAWRLSGVSLIPERDPRLHESLAFENI